MSTTDSGAKLATTIRQVQDLYDRHLYLDAYAVTADLWQASTDIQSLSIDHLVLGGRLAARLGGMRLSRRLLREAFHRDPDNPRVRYFARYAQSRRVRLLDELLAFESQSDLGGDDPEIRAAWYASYAYTWAALRDFARAHECLTTAHALFPDDSWICSCESNVLGMEDRWDDALVAAERGWELDPGAPYAINTVGTSLLHLERIQEAADRVAAAAESTQSFQVVVEAIWYQCALAETLENEQRQEQLEKARFFAEELPRFSPLADREARAAVARAQLDVAGVADDRPAMERWSTELRSPFHRQLLKNLQKNPGGKRIRLPFRRIVQKYQTCVPASVAVALSASGGEISAEQMASAVTFGGTYEWSAADWLRTRDFHVRFFPVTVEVAKSLIEHQVAFVVSWEADGAGHAVAVIGFDERAEILLVHDPGVFRQTEYLLTVLNRDVSPLGIKGMAVVPKERASELNALLPAESAVMEAAQEHQKAIALHGPDVARQIVVQMKSAFPNHPGTLYLECLQDLQDGHVGRALQGFRELLGRFPNSPHVRVGYLSACRALGNSALIRETLRDIVEKGVLPGLKAQQDWVYPPERYVCEYADLLALSAATRDQAESMLHALIRRQGNSAAAWHNLADLLAQKREMARALLCYRLASCLSNTDDHYARAYADALADVNRTEEGFRWLEQRVQRFGTATPAISTWITFIAALEDHGYPERAIAACKEELSRHSGSPELLSFAVPFLARMSDWELAEQSLSQLQSSCKSSAFHQASVHFYRMRGELKRARESAAAWVRELPLDMRARRAMLELIAVQEGAQSALRTAADWMRENKGHDDFEQLYCAQVDNVGDAKWKKYLVLRRRLKRNPEDGWAWREAAFCALQQYEVADRKQQQRLQRRICNLLSECDRTSKDEVATLRAHALWAENRGDWSGAIAKWLETIQLNPTGFYSYRRIWDCSARLDHSERDRLWQQIEPLLLSSPGHLPIAREVMGLLDEKFGLLKAQAVVQSWVAARPTDPNVVQAAADLLSERGHGRSDALAAAEMLKPAVERFPYHSGLRFSLANAYRRAGQDSAAESVLSEIVRRNPDNSTAMIQLAWIRHGGGDAAAAHKFLESALAADPRNPDVLLARVQMSIERGRFTEASAAIEHGLQQMPDNVYWRSRAIALFQQCGAQSDAIKAARGGVEVYPRGAYLWLLLGRTLNDMRQFAEVGEIEACLRRSLRFNGGLFEAADLLSILLTEQRRFDDAAQVMREIEGKMPDPSPAWGRLAWLQRCQGRQKEARSDLSKAVAARPWYAWGWNVLIQWLNEDKQWGESLQLLKEIPSPMFTQTTFRLERLQLLKKAGLEQAQLDAEWDALLRDFPEDVTLCVRRYDSLVEDNRYDVATPVLASILQVEPDNPYILARRVEDLARTGDEDDALKVALKICFSPREESWPADKVWDVAITRRFAERLYQQCFARLSKGEKPTLRCFMKMVAYLMRTEDKQGLQSRTKTWVLSGAVKQLARLDQLVRDAGWRDAGSYRAELYRELLDYGYHRVVKRLWKRNPNIAMDVGEWSQVGRAMVGLRMHSAGRQLLGMWRRQPGVAMWMVTNYTLCLSLFRSEQLKELQATCRDALSGLPHDHCATYLAHVLAEASALLGDKEAFLSAYKTYSGYFDQRLKEEEYFQPKRRHLLADIPKMARYLQRNETWHYRQSLWKLRWASLSSAGVAGARSKSVFGVPWLAWWAILFFGLQLLRSCQ